VTNYSGANREPLNDEIGTQAVGQRHDPCGGKPVAEPSKQRACQRYVIANPQIVAAALGDGAMPLRIYRRFKTITSAICDLDLSELQSIVPPKGFWEQPKCRTM